METVVIHIAS